MADQFSHLIYSDQAVVTERLTQLGATNITNLNPNEKEWQNVVAFGFVLERRAWIVLRGSDDLNDWAANLLFVPSVQFGFPRVWDVMKKEALAFGAKVRSDVDAFVLTGHSLGGAVATLAARDFSKEGYPIEALITFGAPRVGSYRFAQQFNGLKAHFQGQTLYEVTLRYSTIGEFVSRTPFAILGFWHVGRDRRFDESDGMGATLLNNRVFSAVREACFDTLVPFVLPLFLPFLIVFGLDRLAFHKMTGYLCHFEHAEPLIAVADPKAPKRWDPAAPPLPEPKKRPSHPLAIIYVCLWILAALSLIAWFFVLSVKSFTMPFGDVVWVIVMLIGMQVLGRLYVTPGS